MNRRADIAALLRRAASDMDRIHDEYQKSLQLQQITRELQIDIKNHCENLRSVLDYVAHNIREKYCPQLKPNEIIYFPIRTDPNRFARRMSEWFPGLQAKNAGLYSYLESVQPYHPEFAWMAEFAELTNANKHHRLVPQTRVERDGGVQVTGPSGGYVRWHPENVRFGTGGEVRMFGVPVDPSTQLPVPHPSIRVERVRWVDFRFEGMAVSALPLLRQFTNGVREITNVADMLMLKY